MKIWNQEEEKAEDADGGAGFSEEAYEEAAESGDGARCLELLMAKALKGDHSEKGFLRCGDDLRSAKEFRKAAKTAERTFRRLGRMAEAEYAGTVGGPQPAGSLDLMASMKALRLCEEYYRSEKEIAADMIDEYRCWRGCNLNWLSLALGETRPDDELSDSRHWPWTLL